MTAVNLHAVRWRRMVGAAAAAVLGGAIALSAAPASANALVLVPPGCGSYSGTWVQAARLDDHSGDPGPLGSFGMGGSGYQVPLVADVIVVGTVFSDRIEGSALGDVICGLRGNDWIYSGAGDDEIFGGLDGDSLWGEAGADTLWGGDGEDWMWGDNPANSNNQSDGADELHGGVNDDTMFGGLGGDGDDFHGGSSGPDDCADGQGGVDIYDGSIDRFAPC
ncbi:calcium-binding protein [Asanoa sp. NPDC049518]|uniref:calcium-binding protein n=1 Tax=unclassified Asanoa TaxID=2685164 RepID=UPI00342B7EA1